MDELTEEEARLCLKEYLNGFDMLRKSLDDINRPELRYQSYEGYCLDKGTFMLGAALPEGIKRGTPKQCFQNAYELAMNADYRYCEGWALNIIPTLHAWVIDHEGTVIDPTWEKPENCWYWGVTFDLEYLLKVICRSETHGIFYKRESFGLLGA